MRVSSEAQAGPDRHGLPAQREVCARIARAHGLEISEWVALEGVSGAAVLEEPRFQRVLDLVRAGAVAGVVVADFDRLFRRGRFADFAILDAFADSGAIVWSSDGAVNPAEDGGALISLLKGELSGQERRKIAERTRRGRERRRRLEGVRAEGAVGMPRGVAFEAGRWSYVFPEAERVREVFRLWLESDGTLPFAEIARRVGIGVGCATNGSWGVRSALSQPLYRGAYRVDRRWVGGRPRPREPEDCYEHQVLDPPLVTPAEWHRAQKLLAARARTHPPRRDPELLDGTYAGVLDCAACGAHLWHQPGAWRSTKWGRRYGHPAYVCPNAITCPTSSTSIRLADPAIDDAMAARLGSAEVLERLIAESQADLERRAPAAPTEATRRLTELANREARAKEAYLAGALDLRELAKERAAIIGERSALEALLARDDGPIAIDCRVVVELVRLFTSWPGRTRERKRAILRDFQVRVRVRKVPPETGRRARMEVASVRLGVFRDDFSIYKKLKRHGIQ